MAKTATKKPLKAERKVEIVDENSSNFFGTAYYDYAIYVLEQRAIPSIIDGLKPGARKIMHAAFQTVTEKSKTNFMDIVGSTMNISKYHHGNSSIEGTIETLGQQYTNNLAPLTLIGSTGTLKDNVSAAGRYLFVRLSKWSRLLKQNENILEYNYDNGVKVEPKHYLPIIPLVLANRTSGIAIGFSYSLSTSYNPYSLTTACIEYLKTGEVNQELIPHINEWQGSFIKKQSDDKVFARGKYEVDLNKGIIDVHEFSPEETFSSFENNLKALSEKGSVIKWENFSYDDKIHYKIYSNKAFIEKLLATRRFESTYKLSKWLDASTLNMLDENSKLKEFDNIRSVLTYFVDYRLQKYSTLKSVMIADFEKQIKDANILRKFIDLYLSGKIVISKDISIEDLEKTLDSFELPHYVIDIPIRRLTKEEYAKLTDKIQKLENELSNIRTKEPKDLYLTDLDNLAKELQPEFPISNYEVVSDETLVMK